MMLVALIATTGAWAQLAFNENCAEVSPFAGPAQPFAIPQMSNRAAASFGDLVLSFAGTSAGQQAICTDGSYIYTASWQSAPVGGYTFYQYNLDGTFVEGFDIAGATGIRDITYDGTYFYGTSGGSTIFILDLSNRTLVGTITCSGLTSRHISYDPVRDGFWSGNWSTLSLYDRSGNLVQTAPETTSAYGSAYYADTEGEEHLLLFCQPNSDVKVYDYNITTNTLSSSPVFDFASLSGVTGIAGGCYIGEYNGQICFFGNVQQDPNLIGIYAIANAATPAAAAYQLVAGETEHGTLKFKVDGEEVTEAPAGQTVTVTVTPATNYSVNHVAAYAFVDWGDALTPKIAILKDIEVTGSGNEWSFTMPAANVEFNVYYQKDAKLNLTGGDITAALNDASEGLPFRDLTLTLASGDYTISEPISATGSIIINGPSDSSAKIDASGLSGDGFISYTEIDGEKAKKDDGTESAYTILKDVKIVGVTITGLAKPIVNNTVSKVIFKNLIVDNSVIEIVGSKNVFNLGVAYAEKCNITKSTIWSKAGQTGFFFKADGKPADVNSTATTTWTVDQCDLYNISVGKKCNNSNGGIKGKKTTTMVLKNSILYNFASNKGNEVNGWLWGQNGGANAEYSSNCYWDADGEVTGWTDASKGGSDQSGTAIVGKPYFKDPDNGDFTIGDEIWDDEPSKARIGDPRWLSVYKPESVTAPIELMPLDGADLAADVEDAYREFGLAPAYITLNLRPGAHYTVSKPIDINATINIIGDESNPAVIDLSQCNGPMVEFSNSLLPSFTVNDLGFYEQPFNVIFKNVVFSQVKNQLFYANKQKYLVEYFTFENCIAEYMGGSKTIFDFNGGGVVDNFTINKSTIYGNSNDGQKHTGFLYSSQSGQKATEAGLTEQKFNITNSTLYNIANGKNVMNHRQNGQTWLTFTVKNSVIFNCGKKGQFSQGLNGGQPSNNPHFFVHYNSFMWFEGGLLTDVDDKTGNVNEEVTASWKNTYPENAVTDVFTKFYEKDEIGQYTSYFRGNFTVAEGSVQKINSVGDPRWLRSDNEYTDIQGVNAETLSEGAWYTIQGVRVDQPTKGLYIHNGKKVMVK